MSLETNGTYRPLLHQKTEKELREMLQIRRSILAQWPDCELVNAALRSRIEIERELEQRKKVAQKEVAGVNA